MHPTRLILVTVLLLLCACGCVAQSSYELSDDNSKMQGSYDGNYLRRRLQQGSGGNVQNSSAAVATGATTAAPAADVDQGSGIALLVVGVVFAIAYLCNDNGLGILFALAAVLQVINGDLHGFKNDDLNLASFIIIIVSLILTICYH